MACAPRSFTDLRSFDNQWSALEAVVAGLMCGGGPSGARHVDEVAAMAGMLQAASAVELRVSGATNSVLWGAALCWEQGTMRVPLPPACIDGCRLHAKGALPTALRTEQRQGRAAALPC